MGDPNGGLVPGLLQELGMSLVYIKSLHLVRF